MEVFVEVIDTWNMTISPVASAFLLKKRDAYFFSDKDGGSVTLPGRPFFALRLRLVR
jgi:hypothetical protein